MVERTALENSEEAGDSKKKKQDKKMKFIPSDSLDEYLDGSLDAEKVNACINAIGKRELRTQVKIRGEKEPEPYHVGIYHFSEGCGLYVIVGTADDESKYLIDDLLMNMDSIGGKRSSGLGRFRLCYGRMSEEFEKRLEGNYSKYIALSVCLPSEESMENALQGVSYSLLRRGGFVASETYSPEWRRKRDFYVFAPGSSFTERFQGGIYDVSSGGSHPVYRYAKPMWMGVNV